MCNPSEVPPGRIEYVPDESCISARLDGHDLATFVLDTVREMQQHHRVGNAEAVTHRLDLLERVLRKIK